MILLCYTPEFKLKKYFSVLLVYCCLINTIMFLHYTIVTVHDTFSKFSGLPVLIYTEILLISMTHIFFVKSH